MKKLLSLPPNLVECFYDIEKADRKEWFCTSDPIGSKLGSGGGTAWLLQACKANENNEEALTDWLAKEKRILLHAGGQSRRLPGYAPSGKILTPIPVFRWGRGQRLTQNLLSLQLPLYEQIMQKAPDSLHTLIASGDVYIRAGKPCRTFRKQTSYATDCGWTRIWPKITESSCLHATHRSVWTSCCRSPP